MSGTVAQVAYTFAVFSTQIAVDLPSEAARQQPAALRWLMGFLSGDHVSAGPRERPALHTAAIVRALADGFASVGVKDVLSVVIDRRATYVDQREVSDDLEHAVAQTAAAGDLGREFKWMRLAFSHRVDGLHVLADVQARGEVAVGEAEIQIRVIARPESLVPTDGELPAGYAARVKAWAENREQIEAMHATFSELVGALVEALPAAAPGAEVSGGEVGIRLVRPGVNRVGRFRDLRWGSSNRRPSYRAVPARKGPGAYDTPFDHHYFDAYWDLSSWILCESIFDERWQGPEVEIVDRDGAPIMRGRGGAPSAALEPDRESVRIGPAGIWIDPEMDVVRGIDPIDELDIAEIVGYAGSFDDAGGDDDADAGEGG